MADNTTLNTGTGGDVIASDDIAGVKYQRVKLIHGADGANAGDVSSANGLPVKIDQTTPGTTDLVSVATGQGAGATVGVTSGAAVVTDANGTLQQYLRGLVKLLVDKITINIAASQTLATLTSITNAVTVNKAAVTNVTSTALEASRVLKASAGSLVSLMVTNTATYAQWILVMNSASVPSNGAVTLLLPPIAIGASETIFLQWDTAKVASTGIAVCNSSTGTFTKTIGSADCVFDAQVI